MMMILTMYKEEREEREIYMSNECFFLFCVCRPSDEGGNKMVRNRSMGRRTGICI
jgi:hypothetical protein